MCLYSFGVSLKPFLLFGRRHALVLLFALFMSLHVWLMGRVWWWNIFLVIPPNVFLGVFVILFLVGLMRRRWIGLLILCLSFPLVWMNSDVVLPFAKQVMSNANGPVIFNWNTEYWQDGDRQDFYAFIHAQQADVILLQEHMNRQDEPLLHDFDEITQQFPGYTLVMNGELITLTKYPIVDTVRSTQFLRTDLRIQNQVVSVYNVHLSNPVNPSLLKQPVRFMQSLHKYFVMRSGQFTALEQDISANPLPHYIAGDFNTSHAMGSMRWFLTRFTDAATRGTSHFPATWTDRILRVWRIDWALADPSLPIASYEIIPVVTSSSDHAGLRVSLSME